MCEVLDNKQVEQMRPSQNLINEEFILPLSETQRATPPIVTKGLHDSVQSQEDKFHGVWAVYNVHFGPIERKTITNAVNSEQSLSNLNPEAAEYQPQEYTYYDPLEETIRALGDHSTTDSFIPRRNARIQERLINNRPNGQNNSTTDQCVKVDVSVQSDIKSDGDDNAPKSTPPSTVNTNGVASSTSRQQERELDDSATEQDTESQRSEQNDGDNGDDNKGRVQKETATTEDDQELFENEVQQQDSAIAAELIKGILNTPDITENDYMLDEDFADIYKYIKYDTLRDDNAKNKKLLLIVDFYYIDNDKLFKIASPRSRKLSRVKLIINQLSLPRKFRFHILSQVHDILGHYSYGRLYPTLSTQYYWPQMALTIKQYTQTCDTCQKTKIPTKGPTFPLYPHKIATRPFQTYHVDFKNLTRRTDAGNTCILVIVCAFSGRTYLIPAKKFHGFDNRETYSQRNCGALFYPHVYNFGQRAKFCLPFIWIYRQNTGHNSCDYRSRISKIQWSSRRSREKVVRRVKTFCNT